jgi:acetyl-CoA carboxylase carboxyl transferase alpha subunit/acetyl-CoA carboxylase carboxyl transferase beta subunit
MARGFTEVVSALFSRASRDNDKEILVQDQCLVCNHQLLDDPKYQALRVCSECGFHYSITSRQRIDLLADPKTFKEKYRTVTSMDPLSFSGKVSYRDRLVLDRERTGLTEAALVGYCKIGGVKTVLILLDFSFMGGTMGCVVGEKVALAFEFAVRKRLPVVAVVTSGGVRIQEGMLSLMQMAKTTSAVTRLHEFGLPYITVLANPSTGQAYSSFANLADVLLAEPGALVGFAPLRLIQEMTDEPLPLSSHTAEAHLKHGMVDSMVERPQLHSMLANLLMPLDPQRNHTRFLRPRGSGMKPRSRPETWEAIERVRRADRPTATWYIERLLTNPVELHGDRISADDPAITCTIGDFQGCSVVIIGQQRQWEPELGLQSSYIQPEGFRKAQRAMRFAAKFGFPVITLIDTAGPSMSLEAEEKGVGHAIATTLAQMANLPVPIVAVIIGEGGREGALSLGVADRILMLESAIYTPMSPEGAAALMFRDQNRAPDAARALRLTASEALDMAIIDAIVPEPAGGAHTNPIEAASHVQRAIMRALAQIQGYSKERLLKKRYKKFRNMGEYKPYYRMVVAKEIETLQSSVASRVRIRRARNRNKKINAAKHSTDPSPIVRSRSRSLLAKAAGSRRRTKSKSQ